ncbi:MAG: DUF739 family protein [Bacilli bacterium]
MNFDYRDLLGKIISVYGTRSAFARKMKISKQLLRKKLLPDGKWSNEEICRAVELLNISDSFEIEKLFFTKKD